MGDPHVINRSDVQFFDGLLIITKHSSKTCKKGGESLRIPVRQISNHKFCLYTRLAQHFCQFSASGDSPVILKPTSYGIKPLMYRDVLEFLKVGAVHLGIDDRRVGFHSLQRSGAMHLYSLGGSTFE